MRKIIEEERDRIARNTIVLDGNGQPAEEYSV